eukprot:COSAG02_NODE_19140_length_897_cov_7.951128_1_plen_27_part_10
MPAEHSEASDTDEVEDWVSDEDSPAAA